MSDYIPYRHREDEDPPLWVVLVILWDVIGALALAFWWVIEAFA